MGKLLEINHCRKQFGGITGDLCGFFTQIAELAMALAAVVAAAFI